jgi:uncharacterized membrane protein YsdA (DUF1294 family)
MDMYYLLINLITLIIWGFDKFRAKFQQWRVPEKTLYGLIMLGGGIGALAGIIAFRHKTRKPQFKIAAIVSIVVHLFIFFYLLK